MKQMNATHAVVREFYKSLIVDGIDKFHRSS